MLCLLFWLSDRACAVIGPLLTDRPPEAPRFDGRHVISGVIRLRRRVGRWTDCPVNDGSPTRWNCLGIWTRILTVLTEEGWIAQISRLKIA